MIAHDPIGRDPAQRLARDELSKAIYHQPQSLPARIAHAVDELLHRLFSATASATPGGWWTVVALAALAVAAVSVIAVRLGPVARSARTTGPARDPGPRAMTARELRDASAASAADGDYGPAILQRVRAIVLSCAERGILTADEGRTANEVAAQAGARFPGQRADLVAAARSFDQVRYGGGAGTRDDYERLCALDAALATSRPVGGAGMSRVSHAARRWWLPALLAAAVVAAGAVVALLQPAPASGYLDPAGTGPTGSRALADLLTARGQRVLRVPVPPGPDAAPGSVELITGAGSLTAAQLAQAGRFDGDILLVASGDAGDSTLQAGDAVPDALRAIAPEVRLAGYEPATVARPACTVRAAVVSGDVYVFGALLRSTAPGAQSCYPGRQSGYALTSYQDGSRTITVLGGGAPLTNGYLAAQGDAALGLNLLRSARQVIWVVPSPAAGAAAAPGQRSFFSLVPLPVYLIAIQLCVAALLAAAWRARRLGPLVAERLPVTVRASETVEGHGRLYQARRARDRAAGELRAAAGARIARLAGDTVTDEAIATRAGLAPTEVAALLHGPPPATDQALVTLAAELDTLERKLRQS